MQAILGQLQNKTQNPGGGQDQNPGQAVSAQSAELQGADPTMVLRQLEKVNSVLGVLFVKSFQTMPNVANQISSTMKQLSRAIKEAQQGASISDVVGKGDESGGPQPLNFSAAQTGQNAGAPPSGMPPQ